ncbi:MAG TPA: hypothetical protein VN578_12180 [Candidatus Binatia bacterium]|nr:hypothetical protein [Candidatus Binatia bacterium]
MKIIRLASTIATTKLEDFGPRRREEAVSRNFSLARRLSNADATRAKESAAAHKTPGFTGDFSTCGFAATKRALSRFAQGRNSSTKEPPTRMNFFLYDREKI